MNDNPAGSDPETEEIEDQAVTWFVTMRGEDARARKPAFEAWLASSPRHSAAYDWARLHFDDSERLKGSQRHGVGRHLKRSAWAAGLVAAVGVAVLLAGRPSVDRTSSSSITATAGSTYQTLHGQIRSFRLAGGSSLILDSASRAVVASTTDRRIRLHGGKVRLAIGQGELPIFLEAGPGAIRIAEGVVDVSMADAGQIEVDLVSGQATLQPELRLAALSASPRSLVVGQPVRYSLGRFRLSPVPVPKADRSNWPSGWVEYASITLPDVVREANRYAPRPIVIDDPAIMSLTVSGRFKLDDTATFVSHLAEVLDLRATGQADGIRLRKK